MRPWDEKKFLASLKTAEDTPKAKLKPAGNRAVMYCSTTDPYQVIRATEFKQRCDGLEISGVSLHDYYLWSGHLYDYYMPSRARLVSLITDSKLTLSLITGDQKMLNHMKPNI